jgi:hypothetical protein
LSGLLAGRSRIKSFGSPVPARSWTAAPAESDVGGVRRVPHDMDGGVGPRADRMGLQPQRGALSPRIADAAFRREAKGEAYWVMIYARSFPGWESFGAIVSHLKFVADHHRRIERIAAVTGGKFLKIMPRIADHFVQGQRSTTLTLKKRIGRLAGLKRGCERSKLGSYPERDGIFWDLSRSLSQRITNYLSLK